MTIRLILAILSALLLKVGSRTLADNIKELEQGDTRILVGALLGDEASIRRGIEEGGSVNASIDPFVGEIILKAGKSWVDFPLASAVHLAIHGGEKQHLEAARFLVLRGADINSYKLPSEDSHFEKGFPPAMMFALGLGQRPRNSHAALLQRLYKSVPDKFNLTVVEEWRNLTGNPPLIQMAALANFFDGVYTLISTFKEPIDALDGMNLTTLHVAAWMGNASLCKFLQYNGANNAAVDTRGRTPLHYAALQGHSESIAQLLYPTVKKDQRVKEQFARKIRLKYLNMKDHDGRTAIDLALLNPPLTEVLDYFSFELQTINGHGETAADKPPRKSASVKRSEDFPIDIGDDPDCGLRGGWLYMKNKEVPKKYWRCSYCAKVSKRLIDVVSATNLTKAAFKRNYFSTQRPVVITHQLAVRQGLWAHWRRADFVHRYGDLPLVCGQRLYSDPKNWRVTKETTITVKEWSASCSDVAKHSCKSSFVSSPSSKLTVSGAEAVVSASGDTQQTSTTSNQVNSDKCGVWPAVNNAASKWNSTAEYWATDFQRPSLLHICGDGNKDHETMKLSVGATGSGVPMHSHNSSWNLLIAGKKRWFFVPPGNWKDVRGKMNDLGVYDAKPTMDWLNDVAPELFIRGLVFEAIQYPGDVVFIPHGWHHSTLNVGDTISVSQEFCTLLNTNQRIQPLGKIVYGGNDPHRGLGVDNRLVDTSLGQSLTGKTTHIKRATAASSTGTTLSSYTTTTSTEES